MSEGLENTINQISLMFKRGYISKDQLKLMHETAIKNINAQSSGKSIFKYEYNENDNSRKIVEFYFHDNPQTLLMLCNLIDSLIKYDYMKIEKEKSIINKI